MVSGIAQNVVMVAVLSGAALALYLQWRANARLRAQVRAAGQAIGEAHGLMDQAPLGLAMLDRELRYVHINRLLAGFNGIPAAEHIGKTMHEMVPNVSGEADEPFRDVIRSGRPLLGLILHGTTAAQPGVPRTWRANAYPRRDGHGNIIGLAVAVEEITEQQRLLEQLHTAEILKQRRTSELESVMAAAPAAVFIAHDRACVQVTANPEGARLLRVACGESASVSVPGKRPFEVSKDGVPVAPEALPLQRAAAHGEEVRGEEYTIHFDDGDLIHVSVNAMPLRDEDGVVVGAVAAFMDTTANSMLTRQLRQEAQRKDAALAQLAAGLRAPLAALGAALAALRVPAEQTAAAEAYAAISAHVEEAIDHIEAVLGEAAVESVEMAEAVAKRRLA